MTTHVRYLNAKFADDPTDPQLIPHGFEKSFDFWKFSAKGFCDVINDVTSFCISQAQRSVLLWPGTIMPGSVQIQKEVPDFQTDVH